MFTPDNIPFTCPVCNYVSTGFYVSHYEHCQIFKPLTTTTQHYYASPKSSEEAYKDAELWNKIKKEFVNVR